MKAVCSSAGTSKYLIDLSTLLKFQFQHLLFRGIVDAGDTAGVYRNSLHAFLDADEPGTIGDASFYSHVPG